MTTSDEWYDDWFARVNRRARTPWMRQRLDQELTGIRRDVEASGERAYDQQTDLHRQQIDATRITTSA